eukprot:2043070-Prymnesium_polylepis.1
MPGLATTTSLLPAACCILPKSIRCAYGVAITPTCAPPRGRASRGASGARPRGAGMRCAGIEDREDNGGADAWTA